MQADLFLGGAVKGAIPALLFKLCLTPPSHADLGGAIFQLFFIGAQ